MKILAQESSIWAKRCIVMNVCVCVCYLTWHDYLSLVEWCVCVLSDLTWLPLLVGGMCVCVFSDMTGLPLLGGGMCVCYLTWPDYPSLVEGCVCVLSDLTGLPLLGGGMCVCVIWLDRITPPWWRMCVCYLTWQDYLSLVEGESHGVLLL